MHCPSYSRGHLRPYKHRPAYHVPHRELVVKFFELQQQLGELNKLVHREQVQSQVQRSVIKGLQRELKSATRHTETQRALKEKSIHREEETRRELVKLIKDNCRESPSPESNGRQRRRKKKKQRAEQEKVASEVDQRALQDRRGRLSEQQKTAKPPQVQFDHGHEFARERADGAFHAPTNQPSFTEREQRRKRSIDELLLKFKQNCSLKVRISIEPKDERGDCPCQEH